MIRINNNDDIIEMYKEIRANKKRFPNGTWKGIDGKNDFIKLFKYLIGDKNKKKDLKKLTLKFFKNRQIYRPLIIYFNGKIFDLIDFCYPNTIKIIEMNNVPKNYWNSKKNIQEAFEFYTKDLTKEEKVNLKKEWFYRNKLSEPLRKFYRNSPYLFIFDIYMHGEIFERDRMPKGFWNKKIAVEIFIQKNKKDGNIKITAKKIREYGLTTPLKKFFGNSPRRFLEYVENIKNEKKVGD